MNELYFWGSAVLVGLILLKAIPAQKLKNINMKMREKMAGGLIAILYVLIGIAFFVGAYFLCTALNAPDILRNIITGVLLGAFIGLIPIVDIKYSK